MRVRTIASIFAMLLVLLLGAASAWPQSLLNAITGTVRDQSGAVVPNAKITVTNTATNVSKAVTSDADGNYFVPSLVVGNYSVKVQQSGFGDQTKTGVVVQADETTRVDFTLAVGAATQSIQVTESTEVLRTEDTALGSVVTGTLAENLPLNNRDFVSLAQLVPGANGALNGNQNDLRRSQPLNLSVNGQRIFDNNYRMDGVSFIEAFVNGSTFIPSLEVIGEVSVLTGQYSTQYGEYSGAQVNVVTKSGTNDLHGSAFEFLRNDALNARSFFDLKKPPYRNNQFGVTLGGPVVLPKTYHGRNKTFFFFGYQGDRNRTYTTLLSTVATPLERTGNFSELLPQKVIKDPYTGTAFPNNIIPNIAPQAEKLLQYIPLPNLPGLNTNYFNTGAIKDDDNQYYGRIDQTISSKDTIFFRTAVRTEDYFAIAANPNFEVLGHQANQNHVLSETHVFSQRFINQVQVSYVRQSNPTFNGRQFTSIDPVAAFGITGLNFSNPLLVGIPTTTISGYLGTGESNTNPRLLYTDPAVSDNAAYQFKKHTLRFGFEYMRRRESSIGISPRNQGVFDFSGQLSGNAFADFLLGLPNETEFQLGINQNDVHQRHFATYFQDDWKVTPRLTLNLGFRYEYAGPYVDVDGNIRNFDWSTLSLFGGLGQRQPLNNPTDWGPRAMAPRFGFAYRLSNKTVIRGGYGIFQTTPTEANVSVINSNAPLNTLNFNFTNLQNPNLSLCCFTVGPGQQPPFGILSIPNDYGPGYSQQWSMNVQQQLPGGWVAEVGYFGSHTLNLDNAHSENEPLTPGPGALQSRRPYPQYLDIRVLGTDAVAYFDSLQTRLQTPNWHNLNLLTSYTWGHCTDTKSAAATSFIGTEQQEPQNQYDRFKGERGRCIFDFRHQYHLSAVYAIPLGQSWKGATGRLVKGWSISTNALVQTGDADTVVLPGNPANTGRGSIRPDRICNGNISNPTYLRWFDTSCFVNWALPLPQTVYKFGNSGRGVITGPTTKLLDFSLLKSTNIRESQRLEFRADFFNSLNNHHFGDPDLTVGDTAFGRITTAGPGRQIQLGLRYVF